MKVDTITETQQQFKGNLALYNARLNGKEITYKPINTNDIKSIMKGDEHLKFAPKTLISTAQNELFELNVPFEIVEAAYKKVKDTDETEKLIPSSEYSTPGFFG